MLSSRKFYSENFNFKDVVRTSKSVCLAGNLHSRKLITRVTQVVSVCVCWRERKNAVGENLLMREKEKTKFNWSSCLVTVDL